MAAATYDTVVPGQRAAAEGVLGPTHEPMVPYATPVLQARAQAGSNVEYERATRQATVGTVARDRPAADVELPFFSGML